MSGGEPLWRRVAGLYLSGIPADAGERISTRGPVEDVAAADGDGEPTQEIIMLGEALDLVTLAQGYRSPAVPLLLRALVRVIREVAAERAEAEAAAAAAAGPEMSEAPETQAPEAPEPPGHGEMPESAREQGRHAEASAAEEVPAEEPAPDEGMLATAALEKRVKETDQKLAALTAAVGQLVDVLQRRARGGGGMDRRASPRLPGGNAKIFIHDRPYEVVNWSKGGFQIRITDADRFSRGGFDFHFVLDLPDEVIEFQGRARPVRIERTALAAEFASLDPAAAEKISEIATRLAAAG